MEIKKGFSTSELWLVVLAIAQQQGLLDWLTPEKVQSTSERVQEVAATLQGTSTTEVMMYGLVGLYVYFRNQNKITALKQGGGNNGAA